MDDFPTTRLEFQKRFGTEEQCAEALFKLRWPKGFICPNCGHDDGYEIATRKLIQCAVCHYQASLTAGTLFHKTHLPLTCWFWIIYEMAQDKGGASASKLTSQLRRPYKTIWHIMQKIRHAMGRRDDGITLAGFIEIDEAILGPQARRPAGTADDDTDDDDSKKLPKPRQRKLGRKPKEGKPRKTQSEVVVLVESERFHIGNVAMKVVDTTTYESVKEVVHDRVDECQVFKGDAEQAHWAVWFMGHQFIARKSEPATACIELPNVHRAISLLKHFLMGTYFGVSAKYLQRYLQEFCFRFIRREKQETLSQSLLRACLFALPMTYSELKL